MSGVMIILITLVAISSCQASTCREYYGGRKVVHWYNCCDNCGESNPYCDGRTWQGGSSVEYCGSCGRNSFGGEPSSTIYDCVNCDTQEKCAKKVSLNNVPGLCWRWSNGFMECCKKAARYSNKKQVLVDISSNNFTFCGDGICQNDETPASCPSDCCYQVNSNCTNSGCTPTCCGESSCCLNENTSGTASPNNLSFSFLIFMIFLVTFLKD